jgi:Putative adhesin
MFTVYISPKACLRLRFILPSLLCLVVLLLSACASTPASSTYTTSAYPTSSTNNTSAANAADSSFIVVGPRPDIIVKSENAAQLTFVGSDTQQNISTDRFSLPYKKQGNKVTIDFGEAVVQNIEIKVPRAANLTVILPSGNVVVASIQGQVAMTLGSGTIHIMNFSPIGTNTIQSKSGTIDVSFANKTSCSLKAQTNFGAIVSHYAAISEKRNANEVAASGVIGIGSGALVNLIVKYGSITLGPA